jgi:uncharacterized protein
MNVTSTRPAALAAAGTMLFALAATLSAGARDFVQDQAGMFSSDTVARLNERIGSFNAQTGKEIVVLTTPSLGAATLQSAASAAFGQQNVNGVLIFIARDDRRDIIVPDRAGVQAGWFTPDVLRSIRSSMESQFKSENYDAGITGAVDGILNIYRAHLGGLRQPGGNAGGPSAQSAATSTGVHISMFWWIIMAIVGFLILRSVLRAMSMPRYYGGATGAPPTGTPPGGMPPAGPAYGPGYGYGGYGGGGSFWSGLLGGLGGAWLGNELFRGGGGGFAPTQAGQLPPDAGGGWGAADSGGWQSDAGQADLGGASGGDWSGGGFGGDAGGGDFGGGGDTGGGW